SAISRSIRSRVAPCTLRCSPSSSASLRSASACRSARAVGCRISIGDIHKGRKVSPMQITASVFLSSAALVRTPKMQRKRGFVMFKVQLMAVTLAGMFSLCRPLPSFSQAEPFGVYGYTSIVGEASFAGEFREVKESEPLSELKTFYSSGLRSGQGFVEDIGLLNGRGDLILCSFGADANSFLDLQIGKISGSAEAGAVALGDSTTPASGLYGSRASADVYGLWIDTLVITSTLLPLDT